MDVLNNVDVSEGDAYVWPRQARNVQREDVAIKHENPLKAENAPDFKDGCFVVPRILNPDA